ncbi:MAG: TraR/DksA C4-type zinc finger protein [bacterium]|nr:TraR/DksA C4-type zinc finger protein [bacterium]
MNVKEFEKLLLDEKKTIEETLSSVSRQNPDNPNDWEAKYPDLNVEPSDKNDMADEVEEYSNALGVNAVLEAKLVNINGALNRIKDGTYGTCEVGKEEILENRLRANPAARTCVNHSK